MGWIRTTRLCALAAALVAVAMATYRGWDTNRFVAVARPATGYLRPLNSNPDLAVVQFSADDGSTHTIPLRVPQTTGSATIPVLHLRTQTGIDARLATNRTLYAPMWTWIEVALAAALLAIYGRALVQDPLSVIGFKSWRLTRSR